MTIFLAILKSFLYFKDTLGLTITHLNKTIRVNFTFNFFDANFLKST